MTSDPPSVFTPFLRRFTDEIARDLSDTRELYNAVAALHRASFVSRPDAIDKIHSVLASEINEQARLPAYIPLCEALDTFIHNLLADETILFSMPELQWDIATLSMKQHVDLRRFLRSKEHALKNLERVLDTLGGTIGGAILGFLEQLPKLPETFEGAFEVPVTAMLPDVKGMVERLSGTFIKDELLDLGLCRNLQETLYQNACAATGISPHDQRKALVTASQSKLNDEEVVDAYLNGTPLHALLTLRVPFEIPEKVRFEHTVIVAGSGWGKTQLLQTLIANDLERSDPPGLIILDSTGAMTSRIQRLAMFDGHLSDRILIIDPALSPSLNMFDISTPRFQAYTADQREDIQTDVIALFNYIFDSEEYDLTSQMGLAFTYAVRLMLSRQGSTITDLRKLLEETPADARRSEFWPEIERLDPDTRDFFQHHFFKKSLEGTRASIARRIHSLVAIPAFRRMFTASANTLDLFSEMQKGTIVLVNTNQQLLKDDGMVLFGRFVIARALAAALERASVPVEKRRPVFLIVDEAAPYFDESFERLLTRVRQFKLGAVIAFQHLEQANDHLKSALASSTTVKFAGGVGYRDRAWLAREMNTTAEFIQSQRKDRSDPPKWSQFALYIRNETEKAVSVQIELGRMERMEQMSSARHAALLERNQSRMSSIGTPHPRPPVAEPTEPPPVLQPARPQTEQSTTPPLPTEESGEQW